MDDRVRNYLLAYDELGLDPRPVIEHFEREAGAERIRALVDRVEREIRGTFHFFDAIYCIDRDGDAERWESVLSQGRALGIERRLRRFPAVDTPERPSVGRALSHRAIIAEARWLGLGNVLAVEDDVLLAAATADALAEGVRELPEREWIARLLDHTSLRAVAYRQAAYDRILEDVPATPTAMARWLEAAGGLAAYYAARFGAPDVAAGPPIAARTPTDGVAPTPAASASGCSESASPSSPTPALSSTSSTASSCRGCPARPSTAARWTGPWKCAEPARRRSSGCRSMAPWWTT
jgi:hypothetical protein